MLHAARRGVREARHKSSRFFLCGRRSGDCTAAREPFFRLGSMPVPPDVGRARAASARVDRKGARFVRSTGLSAFCPASSGLSVRSELGGEAFGFVGFTVSGYAVL